MTETNMRKNWFAFVATIRKRMSRKEKRQVTHREAMKEASTLWPKEKAKLLNRIKKEEKRVSKQTPPPQVPPPTDE